MALIFGHNIDDDTAEDTLVDRIVGCVATAPLNCVATHITAKVDCTTDAKKMRCAIYGPTETDTTSPFGWALVAQTEEVVVPANGVFWQTFAFATADRPSLLASKEYWLCIISEPGGFGVGALRYKTPTATPCARVQIAIYAGGFPAFSTCTVGTNGASSATAHIYCTYQLSAPAEGESETIAPPSPPSWPKDTYISGYAPRYLARQLKGYFAISGDLRSIEINASGQLLVDVALSLSGLDIEVNISGDPVIISGQPVIISGQPVTISGDHVYVESGVWIAGMSFSGLDIEVNISGDPVSISGQPVTISGDHVYVESGVHVQISGQPVIVQSGLHLASGIPVTVHMHGYNPANRVWVPITATKSGCLAFTYCSSGEIWA